MPKKPKSLGALEALTLENFKIVEKLRATDCKVAFGMAA